MSYSLWSSQAWPEYLIQLQTICLRQKASQRDVSGSYSGGLESEKVVCVRSKHTLAGLHRRHFKRLAAHRNVQQDEGTYNESHAHVFIVCNVGRVAKLFAMYARPLNPGLSARAGPTLRFQPWP
jgi:hypothetical protein